jgi:hypothetical protein
MTRVLLLTGLGFAVLMALVIGLSVPLRTSDLTTSQPAAAQVSTPAAPEIFASPIHGGCYIAGPSECRIHVEPFTINIQSGSKLALFRLVAIQMGTGYDGPVKSDTETGRLKVYNYGHAQTIFRGLQGPSRARTPQGGEDRQSARRRTRRTPDAITRLEEAGPRRLAESL